LSIGAAIATARAASGPEVITATESKNSTAGYVCLLSLPDGYAAARDRQWPLLVFLHGSGECGTEINRIAVNGPPKLLAPGAKLTGAEQAAARFLRENFIVVSPQCRDEGIAWEDESVLAVIDQVQKECRVDPDRVYLTGLSMGGYGAWSLALRHADRFAAVAPISGGANLLDVLNATDGTGPHNAALRRLGLHIYHGARDEVVPPGEDTRIVDRLKAAGFKEVSLTIDPNHGHDVWNGVYADVGFYAWLLQNRRGK
jgi:predicted peptidase